MTEYTKTLGVKAYGQKTEITLSNEGIVAGDLNIANDKILFVNRYVSTKNFVAEVVHTVVYKVSDTEVSMFEFVPNNDLKDTEFADKLLFWANTENITLEENDWNGFCPILNGYKTFTYVDTRKTENENENPTVNVLALGVGIAGLLITIFGAVMTGLGHLRFGIIGIVIGVAALIFGVSGLIRKKK